MGGVFTLSRAIVQSDLTHCPRRSAERATRTSSAARGGRLGRFTSLRLSGRERSQSSQSNRPNARSPMPPRVMLTASTAQSTRSGSEMLSRRSDSPLDTRVTDSGPPPGLPMYSPRVDTANRTAVSCGKSEIRPIGWRFRNGYAWRCSINIVFPEGQETETHIRHRLGRNGVGAAPNFADPRPPRARPAPFSVTFEKPGRMRVASQS